MWRSGSSNGTVTTGVNALDAFGGLKYTRYVREDLAVTFSIEAFGVETGTTVAPGFVSTGSSRRLGAAGGHSLEPAQGRPPAAGAEAIPRGRRRPGPRLEDRELCRRRHRLERQLNPRDPRRPLRRRLRRPRRAVVLARARRRLQRDDGLSRSRSARTRTSTARRSRSASAGCSAGATVRRSPRAAPPRSIALQSQLIVRSACVREEPCHSRSSSGRSSPSLSWVCRQRFSPST